MKLLAVSGAAVAVVAGGALVFINGSDDLTYHGKVSRIIQNNCQTCHRQGGIGPFPFEQYSDVYNQRVMIKYVLENNIMPPWDADPAIGRWSNDRSLAVDDRNALLAWIEADAPEGNPRYTPEPKTWATGWNIGEPDAIVQLEEPIHIPADGTVEYQYLYVKTDFGEDKWIESMELRPTALPVAHHMLVFIEEPGRRSSSDLDENEPAAQSGIDGFFASWVPGSVGNSYPLGTAKLLPAGAWLKFQLHYTTMGREMDDQTMLGFVFADQPPTDEVLTGSAYDTKFVIPPGAKDHEVVAEYTFDQPGKLLTFFPHMHYRGSAFKYDLIYPDGHEETVLDVPQYDFNWQISYVLESAKPVPAGAILRATALFDNSADNPLNPDPTEEVKFGEQSWHEMMIGYFDWVAEGQ